MKKVVIVLMVLLIIIAIASFFIYKNLVNIVCLSRDSLNDIDNCFADHARTQKNLKFCNEIVDNNFKAVCQKELAVLLQDDYICRTIDANQEYPKTTCFLELANIKGDLSLCWNIESDKYYRGYCNVLVAIKNKDISICEDATSQYYIYKDVCPSCIDDRFIFKSSEDRYHVFDDGSNTRNICLKRVNSGSNEIF